VPFIARWPGRIRPGSESDHVCAFGDSLPTLLGRPEQQKHHEHLCWELNSQQAVRMGNGDSPAAKDSVGGPERLPPLVRGLRPFGLLRYERTYSTAGSGSVRRAA
jgi:hypothetical protein